MNFEQLQTQLTGSLTLADEPHWDHARASWNLSVDQRPAAVVEADGVEDVQAVVGFAAEHGLRVAPQSTGHGSEPLGSLEKAVLLRTGRLREVSVDDQTGVARVGAGALAQDVAGRLADRAAVLGVAPTVGVTGLCLWGGVGWLSRTHGLACNNVVEFDVVLPDGETARVDQQSNPDLFWALRGGGGRCAVVTAIKVRTHPVPAMWGGMLMWPSEEMASVLERFLSLTAEAPDSLNLIFRYLSVPDVEGPPPQLRGRQFAVIVVVNLGGERESAELIAPLRAGAPAIDTCGPIGTVDLVRVAGDPEDPIPALGAGFLLGDVDANAISRLADAVDGAPLTVLEVRHLEGALSRPPADAGAMATADGRFSLFAGGAAPTPDARSTVEATLADVRRTLDPWASPLALLSSAPSGTRPADCFEKDTWERLESIERAHDPGRLILSNRDD